jgi:hypothetical protein
MPDGDVALQVAAEFRSRNSLPQVALQTALPAGRQA